MDTRSGGRARGTQEEMGQKVQSTLDCVCVLNACLRNKLSLMPRLHTRSILSSLILSEKENAPEARGRLTRGMRGYTKSAK